jgi:isoquinoline 1-oxidoreductase subunit beta
MKYLNLTLDLSRRGFMLTSAAVAGSLVVGCAPQTTVSGGIALGDFVRIGKDGSVSVVAKLLEMGQGTHTGLAAIVAEELDADWAKVSVETAPADPLKYYNTFFGKGLMIVGGSTGIANSWTQLRLAGAAARAVLVGAAAKMWNVPAGEISVSKGIVSHASGKSIGFGGLIGEAANQPLPENPTLKDPATFTLVGTDTLRRLDSKAKTTGKAKFTIDTKPEGTRAAVIIRSPKFGGKVKSFNAEAAMKVIGVLKVAQVKSGVAIIAKSHFAALEGRKNVKVEWDFADAEVRSTDAIYANYREIAAKPGQYSIDKRGDTETAFKGATKAIEAVFEFPYLAHATMEPLNAVAQVKGLGVEIWTGSQAQTFDIINGATAAGVLPTAVKINILPSGGSFGRRAVPDSDYIVDAIECAKAMGDGLPVSVQWTREDDMMAGRFRPLTVHHVKVGLNASGNIVAWRQGSVAQALLAGTPFEEKGKIDNSVVEGLAEAPIIKSVPNVDISGSHGVSGVPVLWWRSVGHTHSAFVLEHMVDLCARETGTDPVEYRRSLYKDHPRHLAVLNLAVEKVRLSKTLARWSSIWRCRAREL